MRCFTERPLPNIEKAQSMNAMQTESHAMLTYDPFLDPEDVGANAEVDAFENATWEERDLNTLRCMFDSDMLAEKVNRHVEERTYVSRGARRHGRMFSIPIIVPSYLGARLAQQPVEKNVVNTLREVLGTAVVGVAGQSVQLLDRAYHYLDLLRAERNLVEQCNQGFDVPAQSEAWTRLASNSDAGGQAAYSLFLLIGRLDRRDTMHILPKQWLERSQRVPSLVMELMRMQYLDGVELSRRDQHPFTVGAPNWLYANLRTGTKRLVQKTIDKVKEAGEAVHIIEFPSDDRVQAWIGTRDMFELQQEQLIELSITRLGRGTTKKLIEMIKGHSSAYGQWKSLS
jgi:hypothetical protein